MVSTPSGNCISGSIELASIVTVLFGIAEPSRFSTSAGTVAASSAHNCAGRPAFDLNVRPTMVFTSRLASSGPLRRATVHPLPLLLGLGGVVGLQRRDQVRLPALDRQQVRRVAAAVTPLDLRPQVSQLHPPVVAAARAVARTPRCGEPAVLVVGHAHDDARPTMNEATRQTFATASLTTAKASVSMIAQP